MKFYKHKIIGLWPFYLLLLMVFLLLFFDINKSGIKNIFIYASFPSLLSLIAFFHLLTLIINDESISISLIFNNKVIKTFKKLKWSEIWIIDCRNQKYHITLVPKRETNETHRYKWDELFMISSNYKNQSEILEAIIKNAPEAKILPFEARSKGGAKVPVTF